jgi:hypothetical protein
MKEKLAESFDGTPIQGWVMPPFGGVKEGGKVPTVLMIHGGPHGMFGSNWSPRSHVFSGAGYGVIYLNPRGSTGYGQEFTRGCVQDWGGSDYKDLMVSAPQHSASVFFFFFFLAVAAFCIIVIIILLLLLLCRRGLTRRSKPTRGSTETTWASSVAHVSSNTSNPPVACD